MRKLIVCQTCRMPNGEKFDDNGKSGGVLLTEALETALAQRGDSKTCIHKQDCLWSCKSHCSVILSDSDKMSYLLGGFAPEEEAAEGLLDWFEAHGASDTGAVPFKEWPQAIKGHFIARIPPAIDEAQ